MSRQQVQYPRLRHGQRARVDLRTVVQAVDGVSYLVNLEMFYRRGQERVAVRREQYEITPDSLVLSEEHTVSVQVRP